MPLILERRSAEDILAAHEDLISRIKLCYGADRAAFEAAYRQRFAFLMPDRAQILESVSVEAIAPGVHLPRGLSHDPKDPFFIRTVGAPRPDHEFNQSSGRSPAGAIFTSLGSNWPRMVTRSLWAAITFLVLLVVLSKFAWGPIMQALEEREKRIQKTIDDAQAKFKEAEAKALEHQRHIDKAKDEAAEIIAEGKRDDAVAFADKVRAAEVPPQVRAGAFRVAVLARQVAG